MNIRDFASTAVRVTISIALLASAAWAQVTSPLLTQVSVAKDGTTFALLNDRSIVLLQNNEWKFIEGQLVQISVGSYSNVWGVNHEQRLFQLTPGGWHVMPGLYSSVSAAFDGTVVALDLAGKVLMKTSDGNTFVPLPGPLSFTRIAIGRRDRIYALTAAGDIYKFKTSSYTWRRVQGRGRDITVTFDGLVSVKDFANVPFMRTDAAIEKELESNVVTPETNWVSQPVVLDSSLLFHTVSASKSAVITSSGQPLIVTSAVTVTTSDSTVPNGVIIKSSEEAADTTGITAGECINISGESVIDVDIEKVMANKSNSTLISYKCKTGTFSRIVINDKSNPSRRTTFTDFFSNNRAEAEAQTSRQQAVAAGTAPCKATSAFGASSKHSWVQFNLPPAPASTTINIPGGAHNNYVFPACNRVWWDNLTFRCQQGNWALIKGKYDADGACHGWVTPSAYLTYGNR